MSPYQKKQQDKQRKNFFRKWHRRIGFTAALFLINLSITGILLNHSSELALHKRYITTDWLVEWYGVKAPNTASCLPELIADKRICQIAEKIYFGSEQLIEEASTLVGIVTHQRLNYISTTDVVYIYTESMMLVEALNADLDLPTPISSIHIFQENGGSDFDRGARSNPDVRNLSAPNLSAPNLSVAVTSNNLTYRLEQNGMHWKKINKESIESFTPKSSLRANTIPLSNDEISHLKDLYLDQQITLLKFLQDLHSGRILSLPGKLLTDLVGITLLLLSISGFIAWQRRKVDLK